MVRHKPVTLTPHSFIEIQQIQNHCVDISNKRCRLLSCNTQGVISAGKCVSFLCFYCFCSRKLFSFLVSRLLDLFSLFLCTAVMTERAVTVQSHVGKTKLQVSGGQLRVFTLFTTIMFASNNTNGM